jgi:type IV pilus assembly protein PilC
VGLQSDIFPDGVDVDNRRLFSTPLFADNSTMEFVYTALDSRGSKVQERLQAQDEEQAIRRLQDQGYIVLGLKAEKIADQGARKKSVLPSGGRVKQDQVVAMSRELAIMIETGVPIADALGLLAEHAEHPVIKSTMVSTLADVSEGRSLTEAISKHPHVFQKLYVSLVASAEVGGTLHSTLKQAAEYLEMSLEMRRKVKSALTYPIVLVCAMIAVMIFMVVFLVPRFADMFMHMGTEIPITFKIMMTLSDFARHDWWVGLCGIVASIFGVRAFLRWPKGGAWLTRLILRIPVLGDTVKKIVMARILRALSTLLDSGVSMLIALETVGQVAQNVVYEQAIMRARSQVEGGSSLTDAVNATKVFPGMVCQMIAVGEKSGRLTNVLMHVALYYEREIDARLKALASIIEPVMIVLLGIMVGVIAISIFTPLYSIYDNIK